MTGTPVVGVRFESGPTSFLPGHVHGRRQPSLLVRVKARAHVPPGTSVLPDTAGLADLAAAWTSVTGRALPTLELASGLERWPGCLARLADMATDLLHAAGLCIVDPPLVLSVSPLARSAQWSQVLLAVAPGREQASRRAWLTVLEAVQRLWQQAPGGTAVVPLRAAVQALRRLAPVGSNTPRFLAAAYEGGIPVTAMSQEVFQYGFGRSAQWLDSTFTLSTPNIGARLARDKQATSALLRQAGLPVPPQHAVPDADQAVQAARRLGYPVVIKPADLDGGQGVSAGLDRDEQVRLAFERARALSRRVLIEKHVTGRDYRLTVMDGHLLWAIERQPAGVTGDGVCPVNELVARENLQPARGDGPHAALKRLQLDDEAIEVLAMQGLTPADVPAPGRFVVLRRIANVTTGGRPVAVNERVHADNARLAIRAAQALRLDLAGIDLLIDDISRSWRETGAAICEVNAQPQLGATTGPHLYGEILRRRLGRQGRIPLIVVLGAGPDGRLVRAMAALLTQAGFNTGCVEGSGTFLGDEPLLAANAGAFTGGRLLLTHPEVDAVVYGLGDHEVLNVGLPFDRYDWLVLAGDPVPASPRRGSGAVVDRLGRDRALLSCILPACTDTVLRLPGAGQVIDAREMPQGLRCETTDWRGLVERVRRRWGHPDSLKTQPPEAIGLTATPEAEQ